MSRQIDASRYTAKDHVFFAFLEDPNVSVDKALRKARIVKPEIKEGTVAGWLSKAKRLWAAGVVRDQSSRVAKNVQPAWLEALGNRTVSSPGRRRIDKVAGKTNVKRTADPLRRQEVEAAAVRCIVERFTSKGYAVSSFERDNVGWDLEAVKGRMKLCLEVKGLSGSELCVELTPNEYAKMQELRHTYRLCVVTNALTAPKVAVFDYSKRDLCWMDQFGRRLDIEERKAARCRAS